MPPISRPNTNSWDSIASSKPPANLNGLHASAIADVQCQAPRLLGLTIATSACVPFDHDYASVSHHVMRARSFALRELPVTLHEARKVVNSVTERRTRWDAPFSSFTLSRYMHVRIPFFGSATRNDYEPVLCDPTACAYLIQVLI